jgi:hypothetical protein
MKQAIGGSIYEIVIGDRDFSVSRSFGFLGNVRNLWINPKKINLNPRKIIPYIPRNVIHQCKGLIFDILMMYGMIDGGMIHGLLNYSTSNRGELSSPIFDG